MQNYFTFNHKIVNYLAINNVIFHAHFPPQTLLLMNVH